MYAMTENAIAPCVLVRRDQPYAIAKQRLSHLPPPAMLMHSLPIGCGGALEDVRLGEDGRKAWLLLGHHGARVDDGVDVCLLYTSPSPRDS